MSDVIVFASDGFGHDATVVLVAPDYEIDTVVEHAFGNGFLGTMLYSDNGKPYKSKCIETVD